MLYTLFKYSYNSYNQKHAQTTIPSPLRSTDHPCLEVWYGPVLGFDLGMWNNYLGVIALSVFPFMNPVEIILLLPAYRNRVFGIVPKAPVIVPTLVTRSSHRLATTATVLAH